MSAATPMKRELYVPPETTGNIDALCKSVRFLEKEIMALEKLLQYNPQKEVMIRIKKAVDDQKQVLQDIEKNLKPLPDSGSKAIDSEGKLIHGDENALKEARNEIKDLQDEVKELKKRLTNLENKQQQIEIGQVVLDFEKAVAKYVIPMHKQIGGIDVYNRMKAWMEKKKETPEGKEANTKLKFLETKWGLSEKHNKLRKKLRKARNDVAHPPIDLKGFNIHENLDDEEQKCFQHFIEIINFVN